MSFSAEKQKLTLATAVSEMVPYVKTGGLADVAGSLPVVLSEMGHDCHTFLPAYRAVKQKWFGKAKKISEVLVPVGGRNEKGTIWQYRDHPCHAVYFVEHDGFFDRSELYGTSDGDFPDNAKRFIFFSRAVLEALRSAAVPKPDIIHAHDWQTALIPVYLKKKYANESTFSGTRSVLTVHNLAYQGVFEKETLPELDLPWELFQIDKMEFWGKINFLKGGLVFADWLTTVSPTYAREIQTPDYGAGLDGLLRNRAASITGILNGLDIKEWGPEADAFLWKKYSSVDLEGKIYNKRELQKDRGLENSEEMLLLGLVGRLADQKGLDIILQAIPEILERPLQLIILGTGSREYHEKLIQLAKQFPKKISVEIGFNNQLAHRIYAGADAFLMPSRFEPCGLGQLISFRYGTIPIVRKTGGLADTVKDISEFPAEGSGFVFSNYSGRDLANAMGRAISIFQDKSKWAALVRRVMNLDFSWKRSAEAYVNLYHEISRL